MLVHRLPAFTDNYFWLIEGEGEFENQFAVVDPGDAEPVMAWLAARPGANLSQILLTHHHADHVGGAIALRDRFGCDIVGPVGDAGRIKFDYQTLDDGAEIAVLGHLGSVIGVPGHTLGHIAYWFENDATLFCGDTLFAMGCGRLFEGTAQQMWLSLQRIKALPDETLVYCAHEYTAANCKFALAETPGDRAVISRAADVAAARQINQPTVPFFLGLDKLSNPFLRASASDFAVLRARKDSFR